jgi:hypothetical protein
VGDLLFLIILCGIILGCRILGLLILLQSAKISMINNGAIPTTLSVSAGDWVPLIAQQYLIITWNYASGTVLQPGASLTVTNCQTELWSLCRLPISSCTSNIQLESILADDPKAFSVQIQFSPHQNPGFPERSKCAFFLF